MTSIPLSNGDGDMWGEPSPQECATAETLSRVQLAALNAALSEAPDLEWDLAWDDDLLCRAGAGQAASERSAEGTTSAAGMLDLLDRLGSEPADLSFLATFDLDAMGPLELMEHVAALDRVGALVAWLRARSLVAAAGATPSGSLLAERHVEHEIAVARRTSRYGAGRALEDARALALLFPRFAEALRAGEIGDRHVAVLVDKTRPIRDAAVLAAIEARVLGHATRMTPTRFGKEVAKAIADLDPDAEGRCRRARVQRGVTSRPLDDGLGLLTVVDDWSTISAVQQTLDTDASVLRAERGGAAAVADGNDEARSGACRADALAARVLGTVDADGSVTFDRSSLPVTLNLVMDLQTLRDERDRVALLEGEPVPAGVGREWLDAVTAYRRCVTAPVTGVLLDYGTAQYLPAPLRRFVMARDGECRSPICGVCSPQRLQIDHAEEFPAGPSTSDNTGGLCITEHQLKTAGLVDITDSAADGSCTWTTAWGQSVHIPARPYLHDPTETPPRQETSPGPPPVPPPIPQASSVSPPPVGTESTGPPDVPPF